MFLNNEKKSNVFNLEHEMQNLKKKESINSINSNELNNPSKIEIDCSNSLFNYDGFFYNKSDLMNTSKINFKEESVISEDFKEGEEIKNYFNKSLIDKIENPFFGDDKNESRFFNYDFFNDDNNNDKNNDEKI